MSRGETQYYYYPGLEWMLKNLLILAKKGGTVSNMSALYDAVINGETLNPERQRYFEDEFDGDVDYLKKRIDDAVERMKGAWMNFLKASDAMGIPRNRDKNGDDYQLYRRFFYLLRERENVCDFRKMVRDWAKADLRHMKNGICVVSPKPELISGRTEIVVPSVPVIMDRYTQLLETRRRRKSKKPGG